MELAGLFALVVLAIGACAVIGVGFALLKGVVKLALLPLTLFGALLKVVLAVVGVVLAVTFAPVLVVVLLAVLPLLIVGAMIWAGCAILGLAF